MKTYLPDFDCLVPSNVEDALRQKADVEKLIPIAGGTDVMVWMNFGVLPNQPYQSIHCLENDWRYVNETEQGGLSIGALATYSDVRFHSKVQAQYPLLVESAKVTGALQIQNRGTLAGNIANGSPAADSVPSLLVYDASLRLVSVEGERIVDLKDFYTGYKQNILKSGELIAEIILPPCKFKPEEQYYRKVGTRQAQAISKVVFAGAIQKETVRMAWGSVAPFTKRTLKCESAVAEGQTSEVAWEILKNEISPIDDIRSTADYRMKVSKNILSDFCLRLNS